MWDLRGVETAGEAILRRFVFGGSGGNFRGGRGTRVFKCKQTWLVPGGWHGNEPALTRHLLAQTILRTVRDNKSARRIDEAPSKSVLLARF